VCWPPMAGSPNNVPECGPCDGMTTFCSPELTCVVQKGQTTGTCYRYCCADSDCGMGGACDTALAAAVLQPAALDKVGLCTAGSSPACGAPPASPPSSGACVGGFAGGPPPMKDGGGHDGSHSSSSSSSGAGGATTVSSSSSGSSNGSTSSSTSSSSSGMQDAGTDGG
jgi:hypothetical protein